MYVSNLGMCFFCNLLEIKVQFTPGCYYGMKFCGIIWKLWYYLVVMVL